MPTLLAHAHERRATGTIELTHGEARGAITLRDGLIVHVRTAESVPFLGQILYRRGLVTNEVLGETLTEVARTGRLHGQVLLERNIISTTALDSALVEQTCHAIAVLFGMPDETMYAVHERDIDVSRLRGGDRPPVDPWRAMWQGLRDHASMDRVQRAVGRLDGRRKLTDPSLVDRFGLTDDERALCQSLGERPRTVAEIVDESALGPDRTARLLYLLVLARVLGRDAPRAETPIELGREGIRQRANVIDYQDPYATLSLSSAAPPEAVRAAYLRLARAWNPDRLPRELADLRSECEVIFARIHEAHQCILRDNAIAEARRAIEESFADDDHDSDFPAPVRATLPSIDAALQRGDVTGAEVMVRAMVNDGKGGPTSEAILAWCSAKAGMAPPEALRAAVARLDRILDRTPECTRALLHRGQLYARLGERTVADRDLKRVLSLDPSSDAARRELKLLELRERKSYKTGLHKLLVEVVGKSRPPPEKPSRW